ncbi:transposase [Saccharopolyspora spinosa]|uniref:transposase n=1 Tax=Saccharopolyspora spinosa TaxID=60894 RepID=UPI00130532A6|nr:transposase [Saccharopolyspora spinosa]
MTAEFLAEKEDLTRSATADQLVAAASLVPVGQQSGKLPGRPSLPRLQIPIFPDDRAHA